MFSRRADWTAPINRWSLARAERERRGQELLDLTLSNPTRAGFDYPHEEIGQALARAAHAPYDPQPLGLRSAREALAARRQCHPEDIILTASTSEAYSFLFKLLADPGDNVLIAYPSYPLLEHLAQWEQIELRGFALDLHRRWELHADAAHRALDQRTRAISVVSPNNPTGSIATEQELRALADLGVPMILDEVFRDYLLDAPIRTPRLPELGVLLFSLDGLSKSCGMPQLKLGWIALSGPQEARDRAREGLEQIADNFLSASTPVQAALPELLGIGERLRAQVLRRLRSNLAHLRSAARSSVTVLPVEGGWSVVLRIPSLESEEDFALSLLELGVLAYPGYFFDFPGEGWIVLSLLPEEGTFQEGVRRVMERMP